LANDNKTKRLIVIEEVLQSRRSPEEKREPALMAYLQMDKVFIEALQVALQTAEARAGKELNTVDLHKDPAFEADMERAYNAAVQRYIESNQ
jgi:hypothetical protein